MCPVTSADAQTICAFVDPVLFQAFFRPKVTKKSKNPVNQLWTLKSYSVFPAAKLEIPVLQEHWRALTRLRDKLVPQRWEFGCLAAWPARSMLVLAGVCFINTVWIEQWCFFFFLIPSEWVHIGFIILSSDLLNCLFLKIVSNLTNTAA